MHIISDLKSPHQRSLHEEMANVITHGIGIIFAVSGLSIMMIIAAIHGNIWHISSGAIFGLTLTLLYTTSTLYHRSQTPKTKTLLQRMDHTAIFLLIAGTYTPFTLVSLRGPWGWSLFGVIWGLALVGIILALLPGKRWRVASMVLYISMGWLVIIAIKPLLTAVAPGGLFLLLLGGLFYTSGVLFYGWLSLPYHHAIWHIFVLMGSGLHYFAILFYVMPINA